MIPPHVTDSIIEKKDPTFVIDANESDDIVPEEEDDTLFDDFFHSQYNYYEI